VAADRLKCLFVSPAVPWPPDTGGRVRTFELLRALHARADVHLRAVLDPPEAAQRLAKLESHCASVQGFERSPPNAWMHFSRAKAERWFFSSSLRAALRAELARERYDLVHLDEMFLSRALDLDLATPLVVHHHKLDTRFQAALPRSDPRSGSFDLFKLRRLEACAAQRTRFHVLTSAEDERLLRARFPSLETTVVESGFDPDHFRPSGEARASDELLFLGSLDYTPNVDGLKWFVREVLPEILAERPMVRLNVVGSAPCDEVRALGGHHISVVGAVAEVRPQLLRASALIVPLQIGGGTRLKIVEAVACETPVVSTAIGAEGLAFRDPEHLWIESSAAAFAAATLALLRDPRDAVERARRGRELALERYRWSDLAEKLLGAWQRAAGR
jgi:glycosyltransferase involved in cell wall biosynthesis